MCLVEQEARSSGGLSYQGIFNCRIAFCDGHWVPLNKQPRTETVIPDCQIVEEKAPANCFAKQIAARAGAIASSSLLHVKRHAYTNTAGQAHQQQPKELVIKRGDGGDEHHQMFISKGKHIKNVYEPNGSRLPSVVIEKNHPSTKDVSKRWAEHPMPPPGILTRHSPRSKREQPCQDGTVIQERSKTNVWSKLPMGADCR